ncbi:hypothetical protein HDV02_001285, partial [Globomyces sp. JEL0801]
MNIPVDIDIKIPSFEVLKVSKIDYRYPSTQAPPIAIGDSVLNADGAPFDSFLYLNTNTNPLLFAFQMKLAKQDSTNKQVIRDDTIEREFNKINNAVSEYIPGTDFVAIILCRCEGTFSENNLPSMMLLSRACYDPKKATHFHYQLGKIKDPDDNIEYLNTHPLA